MSKQWSCTIEIAEQKCVISVGSWTQLEFAAEYVTPRRAVEVEQNQKDEIEADLDDVECFLKTELMKSNVPMCLKSNVLFSVLLPAKTCIRNMDINKENVTN